MLFHAHIFHTGVSSCWVRPFVIRKWHSLSLITLSVINCTSYDNHFGWSLPNIFFSCFAFNLSVLDVPLGHRLNFIPYSDGRFFSFNKISYSFAFNIISNIFRLSTNFLHVPFHIYQFYLLFYLLLPPFKWTLFHFSPWISLEGKSSLSRGLT